MPANSSPVPTTQKGASSRPVLSVITVVRGDGAGLGRTLDSLGAPQEGYEVIVVDGDSVEHGCAPPVVGDHPLRQQTLMVSGADAGPYDAMNRGVIASSGDWLWFLNAGDEAFSDETVTSLLQTLRQSSASWVVADVLIDEGTHSYNNGVACAREILQGARSQCHQGILVRREAIMVVGLYDVRYRIAADYNLMCHLSRVSDPEMSEEVIARFYRGGLSTLRRRRIYWETFAIRSRLGGQGIAWHLEDAVRTVKRLLARQRH